MYTVFIAPSMGFIFILYLLVSALTTVFSSHVSREVRYECGPHGKFEYCIDEVPGCVIGCHCHPGYYFDTESKICEPNVKLTQHFRQHYFAEPTPTATAYPTPTTTAYHEDKVQEIPKDTDELGDWLYNQFFKTIESQVINNTNNVKTSNEKPPTRRSGVRTVIKKSKRKSRKSVRGRKKRKYMKEHGLRKKLLRITEDDSLFDSDSDSDYSDSSSIESDYSSDEDSADIDSGSDAKKPPGTEGHDDKDHGHKKVIIFNRRPKPPLPSFIFLPSMDTPYYPPIGLPPPPLVPMYPMVPVPPMAPPLFPPFPEPPNCGDESSKIRTTAVLPTTTTAAAPIKTSENKTKSTESITETITKSATESIIETINEPAKDSDKESEANRRNRPGKRHKRPNLEKYIARAGKPGKQKKLKNGQQSMLMHKLRDKLKGKRRNSLSQAHAKSLEELQDDDFQNSDDVPNILEDYTPHKRLHQEDQEENNIPKLEDVDFKYLSELIHKVNQSKSRRRPPLPFDLNENLQEQQKLQLSKPTRRNVGSYNQIPQLHRQGTDDIYYSNLGRQIASMIRNADSEVDQQLIIDRDANRQVQFHSVLNENSYAPRSFWERSVRSPVPQTVQLSEYLDESRTLKHSNEKTLINLENEVEIFASTPPPLSLQDLENILNTMQKAHAEIKFRQPIYLPTSTNKSNVILNVNLLPKHVMPASTYSRIFDVPEKVEYITQHYQTPLPPRAYVEIHPVVVGNATGFHDPERKYHVPYSDYWMYNPEPIQPKTRQRPVIAQTTKPIMRDNQNYMTNPMRQPVIDVVRSKHTETKKSRGRYLQLLESRPRTKQTTPKIREPKVVKYKSLNYFSGNKHYMFEAASYPLLAPFKTQISKKVRNKPSYFHQQSHHFEYFD